MSQEPWIVARGVGSAVGLLHVQLLGEALVPLLGHQRAAHFLGTPPALSSATPLSKIDRFLYSHAE